MGQALVEDEAVVVVVAEEAGKRIYIYIAAAERFPFVVKSIYNRNACIIKADKVKMTIQM